MFFYLQEFIIMKRFLFILNRLKEDRADLTQMLIIVAGFAVAAVIAITGITQVTQEKGRWTAECINNFNAFETEGELNRSDCSKEGTDGGSDGIFMCWEDIASYDNGGNPISFPGDDPVEGAYCIELSLTPPEGYEGGGESPEDDGMCYKNEEDRKNGVNGWPQDADGLCVY